jgi:hypothetical protein
VSRGQCVLCGDIMESKHRHDFVTCKCGKSWLDGGDVYWRGTMTTVMIDEKSYTGEEFLAHLDELGKESDSEKEQEGPWPY